MTDQGKQTTLRRAIGRVATILGTVSVVALSVGMVIGATSLLEARATGIVVEEATPPLPVAVTRVAIEDHYTVPARYVGQVAAERRVDLSFEAPGTVIDVTLSEGDRVAAGQTLARLDTRGLAAERDRQEAAQEALRAQLELAELTAARQGQLEERGFSATQRFDEARLLAAELTARIAEVDAALVGIDIQLDKAVLRAPFDAVVGARLVDPGATVSPGTPVASLFEDRAPEIRVGLPPREAVGLAPGARYSFHVDGVEKTAVFQSLRPDLDPITRTRTAIFALRDGGPVPFGEIGHLTLTRAVADRGAWLPLSALREGERGLWTVMTVVDGPDGPVAASEAVEVLYADAERAFVRGTLADGAEVVTKGLHRITMGQRVERLAAEG